MKKVLVIEDNENNLKLITYALKRSGYQVIAASNGTTGMELATSENPFFIILDVDLPDINGLQVAQEIRANSLCQQIPIIVMTSFAMRGDRERILSYGVNGYFDKPINPLTIIQEIHKLLGI